MEFHYPNGKKYSLQTNKNKQVKELKNASYAKRGMTLEEDINDTNLYYLSRGMAVIHKKPTPIQIVNVDYKRRSAAVIKEAYFRQASTTDFNGVYKGRYIDFEAKETKSDTSFPLKNFHVHQITHMDDVVKCGGIAFVIVRFSKTEEVFLLEYDYLSQFWERMGKGGRKSITKEEFIKYGYEIKLGYQPRIDYLKVIKDIYAI
ncbi:Holliday junction resolvase RecU [Bacillus sp. FJAT-50079]|uniref:Holliday junction resolvase RecU n=1 Tax=Bacillus sp. FJAT-50079 TaxID=2833577 RepID=UPI001BC96B5E|nr:Holliday junction resolvase RecU [Bacillus sp. FJAT-50079]MBS4209798.1 Holliday junction resolvase RecU [Bacillus sp. FJAT-50079]